MHSRLEHARGRWPSVALGLCLCLCVQFARAQAAPAPPVPAAGAANSTAPASTPAAPSATGGKSFDKTEISAAVDAVSADPNLGGKHKSRTLRWVKGEEAPPPKTPSWFIGLIDFLSNGAGLLLWVLGAIVAALAALWVFRVVRTHRPAGEAAPQSLPSQVLAMDIRPESLPADIGAAALALLASGRVRDALSLLYRGALSRAVHRFGAHIAASYTEGEVLKAVQSRLDAGGLRYFSELVQLWRLTVYAGDSVPAEAIRPLCEQFGARLDGAPPEAAAP